MAELSQQWRACMARGDFAAAWRLSDQAIRQGRKPGPPHQQLVWQGQPVDGRRVLVRCFHGLGDTLQFARYLPMLAERASSLAVMVQPSLLSLLRPIQGVDQWLTLDQVETPFEVELEIMELAHLFRTRLDSIPPPPDLGLKLSPSGAATPQIGVVWRAGDWDPRRSIPAELLQSELESVPAEFHILQRGPGLAQRPQGFGLVTGSDDVATAARQMCRLDLLLSVDSPLGRNARSAHLGLATP